MVRIACSGQGAYKVCVRTDMGGRGNTKQHSAGAPESVSHHLSHPQRVRHQWSMALVLVWGLWSHAA